MKRTLLFPAAFALFLTLNAHAQNSEKLDFPYSNRFTLGGGITQVLLGGFNVQAEYTTRRLVFDYSHGFNINLNGTAATLTAQDQKLAERLKSTLGIGYRITPFFDLRLEPKLHYWETYYDGMPKTAANRITSYKTVTVGVGLLQILPVQEKRKCPFGSSDYAQPALLAQRVEFAGQQRVEIFQ